jgi:flagellar biosynthesis protein
MSDERPIPDRRRRAVALRYDTESDSAPRIVAKGQGYLADRIVEIAREHDVHIHSDPQLAGVLSRLDIDTEIPETLYRAIAEVLAFVYRMNQRAAEPGIEGKNR